MRFQIYRYAAASDSNEGISQKTGIMPNRLLICYLLLIGDKNAISPRKVVEMNN